MKALVRNQLKEVTWTPAHENGCPCDEDTCMMAARGGHLEVLKYLKENHCPWDESTCEKAAKGGHLDVLEYLHENGCPWDESTCSYAARGGHLDVLKYARDNGCPERQLVLDQKMKIDFIFLNSTVPNSSLALKKFLQLNLKTTPHFNWVAQKKKH